MMSAPRTGTVHAAQPEWRFWVSAGVWTAVVVGLVLGFQTFGLMIANGVGIALGAEPDVDLQVRVFWTFVAIAIGLTIIAIAAVVVRRWVAFALALIIVAACVVFAFVQFSSAATVIFPAAPVEHVDPGPAPCACYSGSFCDCPGG